MAVADAGGWFLSIEVLSGTGLLAADRGGTSDPYVVVDYLLAAGYTRDTGDNKPLLKTPVVKKTLEPRWDRGNRADRVEVDSWEDEIVLRVFDKDLLSKDDPLGEGRVVLERYPADLRAKQEPWEVVVDLSTQGSIAVRVHATNLSKKKRAKATPAPKPFSVEEVVLAVPPALSDTATDEAKALHAKAAAGDHDAEHDMGAYWLSGREGLEASVGAAKTWYLKAAAAGSGSAMLNLGVMAKKADDDALARDFFRLAVSEGDDDGARSACLKELQVQPADWPKAIELAKAGDWDAVRELEPARIADENAALRRDIELEAAAQGHSDVKLD
jgi:C2 domain